jgi:endonuclease/exonuclease/phosphatase (EEP) superfamily protein YafD
VSVPLVAVLAAVAAALGLAVSVGGSVDAAAPRPPSTYTLAQMNLCLSGVADCFAGTEYPAVVDTAIDRILEDAPDAVTINEACSGDVGRMAAETGYRMRFATVLEDGAPLGCVEPSGRGVFGIAVLTRERIADADDGAFGAQPDAEERRWMCATTVRGLTACTAHLSTRGTEPSSAANDAQCAELASVLAWHRAVGGPTIFGGDVNRADSCAPAGMWTVTDAAATQTAGIQHAYGSGSGPSLPWAEVEAAAYSDHDLLLAHSDLAD